MSRAGDIEARWRESRAATSNVVPLPPQWFDETVTRLQSTSRRNGVREGYKFGMRHGMLLGIVWGIALSAAAVLLAIELRWLQVL